MGTFVYSSSCLSWKNNLSRQVISSHLVVPHGVTEKGCSRIKAAACSKEDVHVSQDCEKSAGSLNRRSTIVSGVSLISSVLLGFPGEGSAVVKQGLLAGRVPGLSEPDEEGWRTYRRPDDKSGGHGVGWSPIIPYAFSVPDNWEEVPVSIADLGGTEIDLRFANPKEGRISVVVAPVKRFSDEIGEEATIEQIGPPDKVISAFGPEVIGESVEGKVLRAEVAEHSGRKYYQFELEPPHVMITATAAGNRLYLFNVTGNGLQWKKYYKDLRKIAESFRVV
ncbi:psbP domain-containing protein 4, chloroplastic isoform X1 [Nicotiana tomentosiformis]|uniref:psbP domain-containing protein 4, chloroplastic isoform X1 n=1 Tax=Nicotiana tomentosiformis TaxID=4098 RepID=UPI00051B90A5|nr:psbP domain-containing protein 4, chloroplastic isoform X1 [Nicotiana tomentosiformis]